MRRLMRHRGYVHHRFRWYLVTVPSVILFLIWFSRGIQPSFSWDQVMDRLGVQDRVAYTRVAVLGIIITATVIVLRILRGPRKEDDE